MRLSRNDFLNDSLVDYELKVSNKTYITLLVSERRRAPSLPHCACLPPVLPSLPVRKRSNRRRWTYSLPAVASSQNIAIQLREQHGEEALGRCHFFSSFFYKRFHNAVGNVKRSEQRDPKNLEAAYQSVKR